MLRDDAVLEPILEDSRLPELLEELNVRWKNEQQDREGFYQKMRVVKEWLK